jgi:hypothetical protein
MTWVITSPLRDPGVFCGCPPCGLCYDWADGEEIQDGIVFIAKQLLGKKRVTQEERAKVIAGLKLAHEAIRLRDAKLVEEHDETQQVKRIALQTKGVVRSVVADRKVKTKRKQTVILDNVPAEKVAAAAKKKPKQEVMVVIDEYSAFKYTPEQMAQIDVLVDRNRQLKQRAEQDPRALMQELEQRIRLAQTPYDRMLAEEAYNQARREYAIRQQAIAEQRAKITAGFPNMSWDKYK